MHTNRNIYSHTETIHTPTTGAQSHRITRTSTQYYTRSHINNHTSQTHPHKATHTVPHTVIRTHPSQGHTVIHNNRHFPLQPRPFSLNRQYSVFIPAQTSRCFTSNLPCKASVVRNSSEPNTPSSRTAPRRAAGLNTRRPLGKVVQHCIHCIHMASGWILTRDPHNHSPPHRFSPPLSLRPCPGIFWRWLAPWFLVGVSPNYG